MATDIYNRNVEYGGSFSADGVTMTFDTISGPGFLVQQAGYDYRQQVTQVYELGSPNVYVVAGRTQGQASLARMIGPRPLALEFYVKFGDVCKLQNNHISFGAKSGSCGLESNSSVTLRHCLAEGISGRVNAGDFLFQEQIGIRFLSLEMAG